MDRSALIVLAIACGAAPAAAADLTVTLRDPRTQDGALQVAVVDAAGYAGKAKPLAAQKTAPSGAAARLVFPGLAPGRYAVTAIHDENGNGQFDTNLIGMPLEGYGFSNNPQVMRKPTFDEAAFELTEAGAALDIAIR